LYLVVVQIPNNAVYPPSPLCIETVNGIHGVLGCSQILGSDCYRFEIIESTFKFEIRTALHLFWNTSPVCWVRKFSAHLCSFSYNSIDRQGYA